jgi:hypothetical protein
VVSRTRDDAPSRRDFFVSYAGRDQAWAEWLGWQLEEAGFTVELDVWHWAPGQDFVIRMERALEQANRLLAVWTDAYFQRSKFGQAEFRAAFVKQARDEGRILPVLVEPASVPDLYASLIYVDLVGLDEATAADRLRRRLAGGRPTTTPAFPVGSVPGRPGRPGFAGRSPQVWNVPARNPHFIGRGDMLRRLRERLRSGEGTLVVQALYGLGGVGKSQLAMEYAHRFAADYDLVWWIDAEQPVLIAEQLASLGGKLDLPIEPTVAETVETVLGELRRRQRWLLIFDNAERPQHIADYRPGGSGHVLVTSRSPGWGMLGGRLEVDVLARSETVALLQHRIPELDTELADQLAVELGDLPLAAAQCAAYLEQTALPPGDYLRRFRSRRASLLAKGDVLGYQGRLDTAWTLSLLRLRTDSPAAVLLLELAAFLAAEPIPLCLFTEHPEPLEEPLRTTAADPDAFADTLGLIVGFSLARRRPDGFQLHRLVQAAIRQQMTASEQQAAAEKVQALLAAAHPGDPNDPAHWDSYAKLAPHVLITSSLSEDHADHRRLMRDVVEYLNVRGDSRTSQLISKNVLDRWRQRLGPDHPDTLTLASDLALALVWLVEYEQARALGQNILEPCQRVLGPDHVTTLRAAASLAFACAWQAEYEQARTLGHDTLERCRRVLSPDHPLTLLSAASLTFALAWLNEYEQARVMGEDTLERCRRVLGPNHPTTLRVAASLTYVLAGLSERAQATTLGQDTLERCRQVLGLDHPITTVSAASLTFALARLGEYEQARILGQETLERCRGVLGLDHPTTLRVAASLTFALARLGEYEQARILGHDTLERCSRVLGPNHPHTLRLAAILD